MRAKHEIERVFFDIIEVDSHTVNLHEKCRSTLWRSELLVSTLAYSFIRINSSRKSTISTYRFQEINVEKHRPHQRWTLTTSFGYFLRVLCNRNLNTESLTKTLSTHRYQDLHSSRCSVRQCIRDIHWKFPKHVHVKLPRPWRAGDLFVLDINFL
jgi:hypothetical protein